MKYKGPFVYPTVDIAIINSADKSLLLAQKPSENLLRFVGGFADVSSPSYEDDAIREVKEETSLTITNPKYIGSIIIDDDRFKTSDNKIKTLFFVAEWMEGTPAAKDDIEFVCWKKFGEINEGDVMPEHRPLLSMLNDYFKNEILRLP
jgi:ADP-ribose pyrophosphatase YjhB (NUDIX family)